MRQDRRRVEKRVGAGYSERKTLHLLEQIARRKLSGCREEKKMSKFYLVKGFNAVAVVQSWNHAKNVQKYFKGVKFKGYDTYDAANEAGLEHLAKIIPSYIQLPEYLILGRVVSVTGLNKEFLAREEKENK